MTILTFLSLLYYHPDVKRREIVGVAFVAADKIALAARQLTMHTQKRCFFINYAAQQINVTQNSLTAQKSDNQHKNNQIRKVSVMGGALHVDQI